MRKKEKIEQALLKMYGDSPEGEQLRIQIRNRQYREEERKERVKDFFGFLGHAMGLLIIIAVVGAALFSPVIYFSTDYVSFSVQNISEADYAYILGGNDTLHLSYHSEERNLENTTIKFNLAICQSWNRSAVAEKFLETGNVSWVRE